MPCHYTPHICRLCGETDKTKFYKTYLTRCKKCQAKEQKVSNDKKKAANPKVKKIKVKTFDQKAYYLANILKVRIFQARKRAAFRNMEFDLTLDKVEQLLIDQKGRCFYSNRVFDNSSPVNSVSIDRRDSDKGYVMSNINLVCSSVNYMKSDLSECEFLNLIAEITRHSGY
jgi:hypothetical protein